MSFNKKDNKLDFRNVKNSQFDPGQTNKMAFSELQSSYRQYITTPILKDAYTHFIQDLDSEDRPTRIEYYQASFPARHRLNLRADNNGDLAGTYFTLQEFISKKTHVFYYTVDSNGTAPGIGDVEYTISLSLNDSASVVSYATKNAIKNLEEFSIVGNNLLSSYIDIEYYQFGEAQPIDTGTTGFLSDVKNTGDSFLVGYVDLKYDTDGSVIYNGNKLKGLLYNPYTASFDVERDEVNVTADNVTVDLSPLIATDPQIINVSMPVAGVEYSLDLPLDTKRFQMNIRDHKSRYTLSYVPNGPYITKNRGVVYKEEGLDSDNNTIYFTAEKDNMVMEIITWK
jgi:hypothetical protein